MVTTAQAVQNPAYRPSDAFFFYPHPSQLGVRSGARSAWAGPVDLRKRRTPQRL